MADLSQRTALVLKAIVDIYIRDGEPVGSKTLSELPILPYSSATIRNIMADLEALGLVRSPHTSAGRVPTDKGYRFFVDHLLTVRALDKETQNAFKQNIISTKMSSAELIQSVSTLLSSFTKMAGVVTLPKRNKVTLKQIEFIPLSEGRVLAILVLNNQEIQNRVISCKRPYSRAELETIGNYLTEHYSGFSLAEIRQKLLDTLMRHKQEIDSRMGILMQVAESVTHLEEDNYIMAGHTNLLGYADESQLGAIQKLFQAFSEKRQILSLFDQCLDAEGIKIYIGEESGFESCSLITAPYESAGEKVGIIGVIGPTRMAYEEVIPLVDMTARLLSLALEDKS